MSSPGLPTFEEMDRSFALGWIAEHPAQAVAALIDAGVLVRELCDECNDRGEVGCIVDGWPERCPVCNGGKNPLYRVVTDNQETTDGD